MPRAYTLDATTASTGQLFLRNTLAQLGGVVNSTGGGGKFYRTPLVKFTGKLLLGITLII